MYKHMMNRKFTLKVIDGTDENGMPEVVEEKENIPCMITYKQKLLISATGQQQTSQGKVLSMQEAKVGDQVVIDGTSFTVISANPVIDFDNKLQGYCAYI